MNRTLILTLALLALPLTVTATPDDAVRLYFPTANRYLLDDPDQFYQATVEQRTFGGQYGFTRASVNGPNPAFFDLFHMGIDIRPMRRDARGEPLDTVLAAADGEVVYANSEPGRSNFGRYVKIRHRFGDAEAYTTYAHLAKVTVRAGQAISAGEQLGVMGHSGNGINRARSHLHFEFGFRTLPDYAAWYNARGMKLGLAGANVHGEYNGMNFINVDPAPLLVASAQGKPLTVRQIFDSLRPIMRVRVPAGRDFFYWQKCYPWMTAGGLQQPQPAAWNIDCDRMGIPLKFTPSDVTVSGPELVWFDDTLAKQESFTRNLVQTRHSQRVLSKSGLRWFDQLTWLGE